jgi:hypothetical protein
MATESVHKLLVLYREAAEGTTGLDPSVGNKWQQKMHACYKKLRETAEGKAGIIALMADLSPHVRCWAGAHSLQWDSIKAKRTLEIVADHVHSMRR